MTNPAAGSFVTEFNRRLGQYTRNPAVRTPDEALTLDLSARLLNDHQKEQVAEKLERQQRAEDIWKERFLPGGKGDGRPTSDAEPKYGNLSQETADLLTDQHNSGIMSHVDLPSWLPGNKVASKAIDKVAGEAKSPILRILDIISRPSYAGFEGAKELAESLGEGQDIWNTGDDILGGAWSGLSGKEKTGAGQVVQAQVDAGTTGNVSPFESLFTGLSTAVGSQFGRYQDRANPEYEDDNFIKRIGEQPGVEAQKWFQRALGMGGEIFLDPTNVVGGKTFTAIGDAAKAGKNTDDAYRVLVGQAVDDSINKSGIAQAYKFDKKAPVGRPNPNGPGKISPNLPVGRTAVHDAAQKAIDDTVLSIQGGSLGGRKIGAQIGAMTVADNASNAARNFMLKNFDEVHATFDDILSSSKSLTKAEIAQLRKDPTVAAYLDELLRITKKANPASSLNDVERILLKYAPRNKDRILSYSDQAAKFAKSQLDDTVAKMREDIFKSLDNQVKNVPGIRIGNKAIPFTRVGKAYHAAKSHWGSPLEAVQFEKQFPSITPQIAQAVKSTGQDVYEEFHAGVQDIVRSLKLTKEERRGFNQRILEGTKAPTARLQQAQDFIQEQYRKIWQREVDAGIRSADEVMPNNYVYNYYKPKGLHPSKYADTIDHYRKAVKIDLKANKTLSPRHIANAQKAGLKLEPDAFRSLLYRQLKSNRQLTQAWFKESLLDNFGIMANRMSSKLANLNKLHPINSTLTKKLKSQLGEGDSWYLPDDINKVYEKYVKLTSGTQTEELSQFIRSIDTVTRMFKQAATIYYPGFHIRNAMGDMFMSFIDGVRAGDYTFLKREARKAAHNPDSLVNIGGHQISWAKLKQLFDENIATGGFKRTDLDTVDLASKANPNRGVGWVREQSERREDFFRFTHFLHAMKEELPAAMKNTSDVDKAIRNATRSSAYRVNKYLFDYGASTNFEKTYLKRIFPFYTYTRKAMPALAEGMFLHPSQFAKTNRFFLDDDDGSYADMLTPQYLRQIGYRDLGGEGADRTLLAGSFLPTDVLNRNSNVTNVGEFARNVLSQTNPILKAGPELAAGKQFWNNKPIEGSGAYFADSFLPPVHPLENLADAAQSIPGVPGEGSPSHLLSDRFGLGIPITQVTNKQQTAALYGILDNYKAELGKLNPKLEANGYRIYVSPRKDGASFRIRDEGTGDVIFDTTDLQKALDKAKALSK